MNKKIKQLWDNSIEEFSKQHQYATIMLPEPLREKFSELIVRECMQIIKVDMYEDAISNMWSKNKLQMIKDHFGVEE
jgi:hypothetical protein